jgi:hypothetical protein
MKLKNTQKYNFFIIRKLNRVKRAFKKKKKLLKGNHIDFFFYLMLLLIS